MRRRTPLASVAFVLGALVMPATAAAAPTGALDPSFGGDGRVVTSWETRECPGHVRGGFGEALDIDAAGRAVVGGTWIKYPEQDTQCENDLRWSVVTRYRPDGSLDDSFSGDGRAKVLWAASVADLEVRAGRTYVAAYDAFQVTRLTGAGATDQTYGQQGSAAARFEFGEYYEYEVTALAIDGSGRALIVGAVEDPYFPDQRRLVVARFTADGRPDRTFHGDGKRAIDLGDAIASDLDAITVDRRTGKILLGGGVRNRMAAVRLMPDGGYDTSFGGDGRVFVGGFGPRWQRPTARQVLLQSGRITLAGFAIDNGDEPSDYYLTGSDVAVVRLLPGGALDTSFSGDGRAIFDSGPGWEDLGGVDAISSGEGLLVAAGQPGIGDSIVGEDTRFAVVRVRANGTVDSNFGTEGWRRIDFTRGTDNAEAIERDPESGRIVLAGSADSARRSKSALAGLRP